MGYISLTTHFVSGRRPWPISNLVFDWLAGVELLPPGQWQLYAYIYLCRRQLIIHKVCVLEFKRTNFSMATRGTCNGNFGLALVRLWLFHLSGTMQIKAFESLWNMKRTCHFQTSWISYILKWDVRCNAVGDADSACCCCALIFLTSSPLNLRTSLVTDIQVGVKKRKQFLVSNNGKFHICGNLCNKCYFMFCE